jgi:hypothetical protein
VPEPADSVSHDCVLLAVQFSVPPPVLLMFTLCPAGFAAPVVPEKLALVVESVTTGGGVSVSVTVTVCGLFNALGSEKVKIP